MEKLTKEQRDNISFAIRWMDGDKLHGVKHVKHDCHICDNPNINQLNRSGWCSACGRDIGWHVA